MADEHRWLGVGRSADADEGIAGRTAATEAIAGRDALLLVVFASDHYDLPALIGAINSVSDGAQLIGCSTAGEIATAGPGDTSVVVIALGGEGFSIQAARASGASTRLRDASSDVAEGTKDIVGEHKVLLLLSDGLAGDQQEVVRGAYSIVGAGVPLVGGCAGDDLKMRVTHQFFGNEVLTDSIVGAGIGSDAPMGIGVRHGWQPVGDPMLVTKSSANIVYTLDDQPALDVYLARLDAPEEARSDPAAFTRFAMTHPFGVSRRSGEEVRFVSGADFENRSIACIAQVPQGGFAWLMEGDDDSVLAATDSACKDALDALHGSQPLGFMVFDCIARRGVLGEPGIEREVARIGGYAAGAPVAGFYTYGEFARTRGTGGFHNQTLVVLAVA